MLEGQNATIIVCRSVVYPNPLYVAGKEPRILPLTLEHEAAFRIMAEYSI